MSFGKGFLFARLIIGLVFINIPAVNAMEADNELPLSEKTGDYDFKKDPFLFQWTFIVEDTHKKTVLGSQNDPQSLEEKILARWKEKQAHLWNTLPDGQFTINASAYTAAADECGKSDGITASGLKVEENRTLACPPSFPFGTKVAIEGMGEYRCEDRGGAIKGNKIDIYMQTKKEAFSFGRRHLLAQVVK